MRIIALETSGLSGSVAIFDDSTAELRSRLLKAGQRSAQSLAPAIQESLRDAGWSPRSLDAVAVTFGPGSFTGLRIGVTTAKSMAYALGTAIVGINSLDVLANAVTPSSSRLWCVLDAHRGELFAASYRSSVEGTWVREDSARQCSLPTEEAWLEQLRPADWVAGPVLARLAARLPAGVAAVSPELWRPSAEQVAKLASRELAAGRRDDLWQLVPFYGRLSAAEEKRAAGG